MRGESEWWDLGQDIPFRPSKERCQNLVMALLICGGEITDTHSLDIHKGETMYNMKPHQIAILFRIKLPKGMKGRFEDLMGYACLTEPPQVHLNVKPPRAPSPRGDAIVSAPGDICRTYDLAPPLGIEPNIRQDGEFVVSGMDEVRDFLDGRREFPRRPNS